MLKINIILRSLLRHKLNAGVIIISLAIGMACLNLILLFIIRELNTDGFHKNIDRIYSLKCDDPFNKGGQMYQCFNGSAEYMKSNFVQVEDICRVGPSSAQKVLVNNEQYIDRPGVIAAHENFFDFFSYQLMTNNPGTVLLAENSLVISEDLSMKYFGSTNAVGQVLTLVNGENAEQMVVTGVFRKPADNTQIKFDMVRRFKGKDSRCFVKLANQTNPVDVEKLFDIQKASIPTFLNGDSHGKYYLEPFKRSYFNTTRKVNFESSRDKKDLMIALFIGIIIFCIAVFNYLGLIYNTMLEKSRIYVVQRINGGSKLGFIFNFIIENLILLCISFIISLILMLWIAPFFNGLTNAAITPGYIFQPQILLIISLIVLLLLVTTFFFVSIRIKSSVNINVLKPGLSINGISTRFPAFNIFQLASSVVLISFSVIIIKQINYIIHKPIGLDKQVIEVKIPNQYTNKVQTFKQALLTNPSIAKVSVSQASPVLEHLLMLLRYKENGLEKEITTAGFYGDENYISTLGIELLNGSDFSGNQESDNNKCLINQSFANLFPEQDLIGKGLPGFEKEIIVGIVKDFHYSSVKSIIEPGVIMFSPKGLNLMVKASENQQALAYNAIDQTWKQLIPDYPLNTETIGDRFMWFHRDNENYLKLIGSCCFISIFLSMIGLFAIAFQNSNYRTREIGIRKINGALISEVVILLNKDFVNWVILALIIGTPVAWYAINKWLGTFAYKTTLEWWVFLLAGGLTILITLLTVSFHSWKAASGNPVEALRNE